MQYHRLVPIGLPFPLARVVFEDDAIVVKASLFLARILKQYRFEADQLAYVRKRGWMEYEFVGAGGGRVYFMTLERNTLRSELASRGITIQ